MLLVLLGAIVVWWQWKHTPDKVERERLLLKSALGLLIGILLILVVTGRLHWVGAILAAALAFVRQSMPYVIKYFPVFMQWYHSRGTAGESRQTSRQTPGTMSVEEALQILGLSGTPDRDEITRAYRKVMQQMHPDRGGNEYFAAKVNQARDVLNSRFG